MVRCVCMYCRCEVLARTGLGGLADAMAALVLMLYVGAVQPDGRSPLHVASLSGHVEVVRALLGAGADVGQADVSRACSVVGGVWYGAVRRAVGAACSPVCVGVGWRWEVGARTGFVGDWCDGHVGIDVVCWDCAGVWWKSAVCRES